MTDLPVVGAAMSSPDLAIHRDWIFEKQRDVEIQDFWSPQLLSSDDWMPVAETIKTLLDGHKGRLGMHGPFIGFTIASGDPEVRALAARRMDKALDIAQAIGADQIVIHSPFSSWMHFNLDDNPGQREKVIELSHMTLDAAVRRAESQGCTFVLENCEDFDPGERRRLAESFNSPAVALSIDTGHAAFAAGTIGAPPVDYFVTDAGNALHHLHLQDADGYADRHWPLGHGNLNWRAIFKRIGMLSSNPRLIIEIKDKSKIPDSAAFLEGLGLAQ